MVARVKEKVNQLWLEARLPAFIQFGMDDSKGKENAHALNGPTVKKVLRHKTLLPDTFRAMQELWELLETEKGIKYGADGLPEPAQTPAKKGKEPAKKGKAPVRASGKKRPLTMDEIGVDMLEEPPRKKTGISAVLQSVGDT